MKKVFLIHGWQGKPGNHWKGWLRKKLEADGISVIEPNMPNESNKPEDWIQKLVQVVGLPNEDTIIIGHSLGCPTAIGYLMNLSGDEKIAGTILVAGFYSQLEKHKDLQLWDFDPQEIVKAKNHCKIFMSIASEDDLDVPFGKSVELNTVLGGEMIVEKNKGHFCETDGVIELPSVYSAVREIFHY